MNDVDKLFTQCFDCKGKSGVRVTIKIHMTIEAHLNYQQALSDIEKILDSVKLEMGNNLINTLESRSNFLDALRKAKRKLGNARLTQTSIASEIPAGDGKSISPRTLQRWLDKHFENIPKPHNARLYAALKACEEETRGVHFVGG